MERLTSDNVFEMNMHQLALNQVYIGEDKWVWYRNGPEDEVSVCDLIRTAADTLQAEPPTLNDDAMPDLMEEWLQYGVEEVEGVLGILYSALCAMAELRARLSQYEDTGLEPEEVTDLQRAWDMYGGEVGIDGILTENRELREKWTPKCYSADTDGGCRYQVPNGDDEPIDRCKRCPLCYVDKQRKQLEPNPPLTLDELREMGQHCEGVYVTHTDGSPVLRGQKYCAAALDFSLAFGSNTMCVHAIYGDRMTVWEDDYGKTWLAYRRKPEEGQHEM